MGKAELSVDEYCSLIESTIMDFWDKENLEKKKVNSFISFLKKNEPFCEHLLEVAHPLEAKRICDLVLISADEINVKLKKLEKAYRNYLSNLVDKIADKGYNEPIVTSFTPFETQFPKEFAAPYYNEQNIIIQYLRKEE
jgi:hypothetical protein